MTEGRAYLQSNLDSLIYTANQCPFKGGEAVYQARGLVEMMTDSIIEYNDPQVCLMEGVYRKANSENIPKFILQPNPANDHVLVSMVKSEEKIRAIRVYDLTGQVISSEYYSIELRSRSLNISTLASGIYLILLESENGYSATQKLIINH